MRVVVLSWDVHDEARAVPHSTVGLARGLLQAGHDVRLVTAASRATSLPLPSHVAVPVADAPPIIQSDVGGELAPVLAFSSRATSAAERVIDQLGVDVVLADGWQTAWTATGLREVHGLPIVAHFDSTCYLRHGNSLPDADAVLVHQVEWWLAYESRRVTSGTPELTALVRRALHVPRAETAVVPPAIVPVERTGVTRGRGLPRVLLAVPTPLPRGFVRSLQRRLQGLARLVTRFDDEPRAVLALSPTALPVAVRAVAEGLPLAVDRDGPLRRLVHAGRTGAKIRLDEEAIATAVTDLVTARGTAWAEAGLRRARRRHDPATVATTWVDVARDAVLEEEAVRAVSRPGSHLRPVPPLPR